MKPHRVLGGLVLAACAPALPAADLLSAWQAALAHDPTYAAARSQWQAGSTLARQGRALLAPQVSAVASAGYLDTDRTTRGAQFAAPGFGASNDAMFRTRIQHGTMTTWALAAQQPLYNVERQASADQLAKQAQMADLRLQTATQDLILRAARAYFAVILADDLLATIMAQQREAERARDAAQEKYDAGASPVTDREEAQARYDDLRARVIAARNDVELRRAAYRDVTGQAAGTLAKLRTGSGELTLEAGPLDTWLARAEERHPLLALQALGQSVADDDVRKYRALTSPAVDLVARLSDDRLRGSNGWGGTGEVTAPTRTVGVQITLPLATGGMRSAKRDEALALADKARHDTAALRQDVLQQTRAAWLAVSTGVERIRARTQGLASAQSRLDATTTGVEVGARTTLDQLNAQSDYYQAQRELLRARYELLLDRLHLAAAAGELDEADVRQVNGLLGAP